MKKVLYTITMLFIICRCNYSNNLSINGPKLEAKLKKVVEDSQKLKYKKGFLVIGKSGHGKSTTIGFLKGNRIAKGYVQRTGLYELKSYPDDPPVGHGYSSKTPNVTPYKFDNKDEYYLDAPGFNDTNAEIEERIARYFSLTMAARQVTIHGIIVVLDLKSLHHSKGSEIKDSLRTISSFLSNPSNYSRNIFYFFTHSDEFNKNQVINQLKDLEKDADYDLRSSIRSIYNSPDNFYLIKPLDNYGNTNVSLRNQINNELSNKYGNISPYAFNFTADADMKRQIGYWLQAITNTCIDYHKRAKQICDNLQNNADQLTDEKIYDASKINWTQKKYTIQRQINDLQSNINSLRNKNDYDNNK